MLARLRGGGDRTPVLVLTTESKRSIVSELIKLGIEDYILKPFKNEDIRAKIERILKGKLPTPAGAVNGSADAGQAPGGSASASEESTSTPRTDILVVDDMDNVHKRLRTMFPEQISMMSAATGQAGLKLARENTFRLVLVDRELPDMPGVALLKQIRVLQPKAPCLAMSLKTSPSLGRDVKEEGYDDVFIKPFSPDAVEQLMQTHFDSQELLLLRDNDVVSAAPFSGRPEKLDRYYGKMIPMVKDVVREVAEACFESVIFDAAKLPAHPSRLVQLVTELDTQSKKFGIGYRLVVPTTLERTLREYDETKGIETFDSIDKARGANA